MESNEDDKTWISNILVRNIFFYVQNKFKTFVCVYMLKTSNSSYAYITDENDRNFANCLTYFIYVHVF